MKDRFNLEDEINQLYTFTDQLGNISEGVLEHNLSIDETVNTIEGLRVMLELQAAKLNDTMCQCFQLDNYKPSKVKMSKIKSNKKYPPADLPG
jgi:hypothetical protein